MLQLFKILVKDFRIFFGTCFGDVGAVSDKGTSATSGARRQLQVFFRQLSPAFKIVIVITIVSQLIIAGRFTWRELRSQAAKYFVGHWC